MKKMFGLFVAATMVFGVGCVLSAEDAVAPAAVTDAAQAGVVQNAVDSAASQSAVVQEQKGHHGKNGKGQKPKMEAIEMTGVIEVGEAKATKNGKFKTVTLKAGDTTYKLIPAKKGKDVFAKLEAMAGKTVKVTGTLMPANKKFPMPAIKVESFTE